MGGGVKVLGVPPPFAFAASAVAVVSSLPCPIQYSLYFLASLKLNSLVNSKPLEAFPVRYCELFVDLGFDLGVSTGFVLSSITTLLTFKDSITSPTEIALTVMS